MNIKEQIKRDWLLIIVLLATMVLCFFVYNEIDRMLEECNEFWMEQCGYNDIDPSWVYNDSDASTYGHSDVIGAGLNIPMQGDV